MKDEFNLDSTYLRAVMYATTAMLSSENFDDWNIHLSIESTATHNHVDKGIRNVHI